MLVRIEAKCADVAKTSTRMPLIRLSMHFGSIFDDLNAVSISQIEYRIHIHRQAENVDHHNSLRLMGYSSFDLIYIHVPSERITVHEYRYGPCANNRCGA